MRRAWPASKWQKAKIEVVGFSCIIQSSGLRSMVDSAAIPTIIVA